MQFTRARDIVYHRYMYISRLGRSRYGAEGKFSVTGLLLWRVPARIGVNLTNQISRGDVCRFACVLGGVDGERREA